MARKLTASQRTVAAATAQVLASLGVDLEDENFSETPARYAQWITEYVDYQQDSIEDILSVSFDEDCKELVAVTNISFISLCAHHLLPFRGVAHIGYIPSGRVVGISKLARAVRFYAKRLTLQERVTKQVADALERYLNPLGVIVVLQASHTCMTIRGVADPHSITTTSAVRGVFKDPEKGARAEFLQLLNVPSIHAL